MNKISDAVSNYWNGTLSEAERYEKKREDFAKSCLPTVENTLAGDVQLGQDIYYRLSHEMPYSYQRASYSLAASALGLLAIPALFLKTIKHLILPGAEGAKSILSRDLADLTKAIKGAAIGAAFTLLRIAGIVTDPLRFLQLTYKSHTLKSEYKTNPDYKKYGVCALLTVDLQRGFIPVNTDPSSAKAKLYTKENGYGELPVANLDESFAPHSDKTEKAIENAITLVEKVNTSTTYSFASLDWHPEGHVSYASSHGKEARIPPEQVTVNGQEGQCLFADHCRDHGEGSKLVHGLSEKPFDHTVRKGNHLRDDSYSPFGGNTKVIPGEKVGSLYWTEFAAHLKARKVETLLVTGLAQDFCVHAAALSALLENHVNVIIVKDATAMVIGTDENHKKLEDELREAAKKASLGRDKPVTVEWKTTEEVLNMSPYFSKTV